MSPVIGYCTNVHSGVELAQAQANLERYACQVQRRLGGSEALPVGLWLAQPAAEKLQNSAEIDTFANWLAERNLLPFTFNGFPQGDFHQAVVKHRVYLPTWWEDDRREYTSLLIDHLHRLLPAGKIGSISTLPLSWGTPRPTREQFEKSAENLRVLGRKLHRLWEETGREIVIAIEPEPGCALHRADDLVEFFENFLSRGAEDATLRKYLGVCHDVCHAAVMFEPQLPFLQKLANAGIRLGKIQVSAAIGIDWQEVPPESHSEAVAQLTSFAEYRYLHQTGIQKASGEFELVEDLPLALERLGVSKSVPNNAASASDAGSLVAGQQWLASDKWRVHFHVPLFMERAGWLRSTQQEILNCLTALNLVGYDALQFTGHFEVETYAWNVLPEHLREVDLSDGIAQELTWFRNKISQNSAMQPK